MTKSTNTIYDRDTKTTTRFVDNDKGGVSVEVSQDITGFLDEIKAMRAMSFNPNAVGRIAGKIPHAVRDQWDREFKKIHGVTMLQADGQTRQRFLAAKLNNSDYSRLRVWEGKL